LSDENLKKAYEELQQWRREFGIDYRGRPLVAPLCECGAELQLWPYKDTGIWAWNLIDSHMYDDGRAGQHDIYDLKGERVQSGAHLNVESEIDDEE
jgi:hypothetical protein